MVDKKFIVAAISVIVALGAVGPSLAQMFQHAEAHGVQAQLQSRFIRIDGETWSKQSVHTGDTLSVSGKFVSLVNRDMRGWYTVYGDSPNAGNRWEIMARDPPGNVITIPANSVVPYTLTIKALEPAVYHMHTQLNIASIGPGLGPGQTVVVTGDPIVKPMAGFAPGEPHFLNPSRWVPEKILKVRLVYQTLQKDAAHGLHP